MTSLETLKLKGNSIDNISALSNLTGLTLLNLKDNDIVTISALSELTNLEHLRLDGNSITDVQPLTSLVDLEKLWISGNALTNAHLLSSLTNLTTIDITIPDPPDTTAPDVSISVSSGTQNGAFDATITFTEIVSDFVQTDLSLGGSATASITDWDTTDNTVFTATITPTTSGTVTLGVAADVATDEADNNNIAATTQTVTVDVDRPTVTITVPSGTQNGAFDTTITFSEVVSNFVQADLGLSGTATASITAWEETTDDTVYTATITPTTSGTVAVDVSQDVATDGAGNKNTAATSQTVTVDVDVPTVVISAPSGTQSGVFDATITFSEVVSGFAQTDLSLGGSATASITDWDTTNNPVFTVTITPTSSGTVTLDIAADVATDAANNGNTPALTQTATVDVDVPTVEISVPSGTQNSAFDTTITFSESVSDFAQEDLSLSGTATASITSWVASTDGTTYTATITPTTSGDVTLNIAADVATDAADNSNTAATEQTVTIDVDAPTVSISVPSGAQNGAFDVTITFTESVSNFVQGDVSLSGTATASITAWSANTDNDVYTATVTPTTSGDVTLNIAADVATDAADNSNTAATEQTVTIDVDAPTVAITVPSDLQTGAFDATITFSEAVSDFLQGDVSFSTNTAEASITAWSANTANTVYTATITPTTSGRIVLSVAAGVATDAVGNNNTAGTSAQVGVSIIQQQQVDVDAPTVSITVPEDAQNGAFDVTIIFSESVTGFVQSELTLSGTATASITSWVASTDGTTYTATITPTTSGTVILNVAADVATDAADNNNTAATEQTVTIDVDAPNVELSLIQMRDNGRIEIRITFTEPVEDFEYTDLSITTNGLTALEPREGGGEIEDPVSGRSVVIREYVIQEPITTITGWTPSPDRTTYTAYIRERSAGDGEVIFNVPENIATDIAGNPNVAGEPLSVGVSGPRLYLTGYSLTPNGPVTDIRGCERDWMLDLRDRLDVNEDDSINEDDIAMVSAAIGQYGGGIVDLRTDINCDNTVDDDDLALLTDTEAPTVSITVPTETQVSSFDILIDFDEIVYDFDETDISFEGSTTTATAGIKGWSSGSQGSMYHVTITPTTTGEVVISVPEDAAQDAIGNSNTASDTYTVTVDMGIPTVSITTSVTNERGTNASGVFNVIVTFSEEVSNFEQTDLQVSGRAGASIYSVGRNDGQYCLYCYDYPNKKWAGYLLCSSRCGDRC